MNNTLQPLKQVNTSDLQEKFINGLDLLNMQTEQIPMLVEDLIPLVAVWAIVGASDTGKSMILRQLAMCVANGKPFIDLAINAKYNRVLVVCSEDDEFAISYLIRKQNKSLELSNKQISNIDFLFDTDNLIETLKSKLIATRYDLIIIDAFSDVFEGKDLNQIAQVRQFLNKFTLLANEFKCSIGFLHHTGKRTENLEPSKNNAIGSQGFEAKMRLVIELRVDKNNPDIRHFCIVKGNYLPQEQKNSSIVLAMDKNLTFTNTGERVEYSKLIEGTTSAQVKKEPSKLEDILHHNFIRTVFVNGKQYSKTELRQKIEHYWSISDKTARRFVDYLEQKQWIVDVSKTPTKRSYRNNLP